MDFQNYPKSNFFRSKFLKIQSYIYLPWGHLRAHTNLGSIGSAVLTVMEHKQTSKVKYIFIIEKIKEMKDDD